MSLAAIAEKLARALGHAVNCPMIQLGAPNCHCGAAARQSDALTEYERWKREPREEPLNETDNPPDG